MKILLINQPLQNHGDEAAHKALLRALSADLPEASIDVLFVGRKPGDVAAFKVESPSVHYINLRKGLLFWRVSVWALKKRLPLRKLLWKLDSTSRAVCRLVRAADLVLCAPGGTCMGWQQNWNHLAMLWFAYEYGRPTAYFGRSIGPFPRDTRSQRLFYDYSATLLRSFKFISLRDKVSCNIAAELGLKPVETLDSAFLGPAAEPEKTDAPYLVFVPNSLAWLPAYKGRADEVKRFFEEVLHELHEVYPQLQIVMLPQTFRSDGKEGDRAFFESLAGSDAPYVRIESSGIDSDTQQKMIAGACFVVGARYHSIVFAINNRTPFLAFSYEHKISGMLDALGESSRAIDLTGAFFLPAATESALKAFSAKLPTLAAAKPVDRDIAAGISREAYLKFLEFVRGL